MSAQIGQCPSGRLVARDNATGQAIEPALTPSLVLVEDPYEASSGPIFVRGGVEIIGADGVAWETRNRVTLCRCGQSKTKPFCDGTHSKVGFDGTETASRAPVAQQANVLDGPAMQLLDAEGARLI